MKTTIKALAVDTKFLTMDGRRGLKETESNYFIFAKGKSRYGYRHMINEDFPVIYEADSDKAKKWENRVKTVIKRLEQSGLWQELKEQYKNLLSLGYQNRQRIKEIDGATACNGNSADNEEIKALAEQYPFILVENSQGEKRLDTFYIWDMSECITKSMYFGQWNNEQTKQAIKEHLNSGTRYSTHAYTNYDVSFEYNPESKKAWYREEYKDCGNGHYYLALDNSLALFCEND